ncbi:MAG TPA: DUF4115 domain-containing protein [Citreicella sp.]|uniref:Protein RodZ, contains Xre-like HTH and DUF4115 domains n=1 Tax=Salipiger marinus TaxID=555512 RepID=A0A1G8RC88_9RHOB|nr:helix-turn-helix domain-containing protein [Salipiger marinus]SDJ14622.1 protein RodZ, contains Xre-like HTH and DUF4115 domains [Salipiger marinus]HBM60406.1 DUF4115 domain-containing protein [Citreicella sp.]HBT02177.1 DUF4115 domain-containing protein [Citreicella sp.]
MIGRKSPRKSEDMAGDGPRGFDDFTLKLGDVMRGERATLGKSLLDVQRELRIKASYIAAIENCDPSAFDTPGFIAGYVRSYARYLGMDPDECYAEFCAESGFAVAHGMSDRASTMRKGQTEPLPRPAARDPFANPRMPFAPAGESFFSRIEPGAIGSLLVLVALIGGIGYGGYAVLREVQRVQLAPVDQTPLVLSDLDPVQPAAAGPEVEGDQVAAASGAGPFTPPTAEAMDRLYRPQALDVPVLVARDAPISSLDPSTVGAFAQAVRQRMPQPVASPDGSEALLARVDGAPALPGSGEITLVAVRPAWVRVRGTDGGVIYERVMNAGETWTVPAGEQGPLLNVGESGAVYLAMAGRTYGPIGPSGTVTSDLPLDTEVLQAAYSPADPQADRDLVRLMAQLEPVLAQSRPAEQVASAEPGMPKVLQDGAPGVTMIAVRPAWVRVRSADGSVIFEKTMAAGETWVVPATQDPATLRVGESGAVYFAVNGQTYGPAGARGAVTSNLALSVDHLTKTYEVADATSDADLERVFAELSETALRVD